MPVLLSFAFSNGCRCFIDRGWAKKDANKLNFLLVIIKTRKFIDMALLDDLKWRYATKKMNGQTVPEDKLNYILEAARLAPSSSGLQPYQIFIGQTNSPRIIEAAHTL